MVRSQHPAGGLPSKALLKAAVLEKRRPGHHTRPRQKCPQGLRVPRRSPCREHYFTPSQSAQAGCYRRCSAQLPPWRSPLASCRHDDMSKGHGGFEQPVKLPRVVNDCRRTGRQRKIQRQLRGWPCSRCSSLSEPTTSSAAVLASSTHFARLGCLHQRRCRQRRTLRAIACRETASLARRHAPQASVTATGAWCGHIGVRDQAARRPASTRRFQGLYNGTPGASKEYAPRL